MENATKIVDTELIQTLYGLEVVQLTARSGNQYLKIGSKKDWKWYIAHVGNFKSQFDSIMMFFNENSLTLTYQVASAFNPYEKKSELEKILYTKKEKPPKKNRDKTLVRFHKGWWALKFKLTKTGKFQVLHLKYKARSRWPIITSVTKDHAKVMGDKINWLMEESDNNNTNYTPANRALVTFLTRTIEEYVSKLKEKANGIEKSATATT